MMKSNAKPPKYHYEETVHNLVAPQKIVPVVLNLFKPLSVIDVGCGTGTFLKVFKDLGVTEVLGLDGHWVDRSKLLNHIREEEFAEVDLENLSFENFNTTYDLAVCLEVAEHLNPDAADLLVSNLVRFSRRILFSAAVPFQGGINHVNEQWPSYWEAKFMKHGFHFYDVIRPSIWNDPDIPYWYKQNIFFVCQQDPAPSLTPLPQSEMHHIVHPDLYTILARRLDQTENLELPLAVYVKMMVKKMLGRRKGNSSAKQ